VARSGHDHLVTSGSLSPTSEEDKVPRSGIAPGGSGGCAAGVV
jgi:hypothetical protein